MFSICTSICVYYSNWTITHWSTHLVILGVDKMCIFLFLENYRYYFYLMVTFVGSCLLTRQGVITRQSIIDEETAGSAPCLVYKEGSHTLIYTASVNRASCTMTEEHCQVRKLLVANSQSLPVGFFFSIWSLCDLPPSFCFNQFWIQFSQVYQWNLNHSQNPKWEEV